MRAQTPKKPPTINEVLKMKGRPDYSECRLTRTDAIRRHCLDCSGFSKHEVKHCWDRRCALYRYRLGREINDEFNPKKEISEEERNRLTQLGEMVGRRTAYEG